MRRKATPSPRGSGRGRGRSSRSRSRGRSTERSAKTTTVTTRSRSRSRDPSSKEKVVKLDDDSTLVRRPRTPTRRLRPSALEKPVNESTPKEKELRAALAPIVAVAAPVEIVAKLPTTLVSGEITVTDKLKTASTAAARQQPENVTAKVSSNEFGGPLGAAALTIGLPLIVLYATASSQMQWSIEQPLNEAVKLLKGGSINWRQYLDVNSFAYLFAWYALQALFYVLPIGQLAEGTVLKNGTRLLYRCNGFIAFCLSLGLCGILHYTQKVAVVKFVTENLPQLIVASSVYSFIISEFLYLRSRKALVSELAPAATGNVAYDFFMGRELNPRLGSFDLKFFFELRPGLIGWALINFCFALSESATTPARLVAAFQIFYVADALWHESAILTTFDILHEGFGFMLVFGDLVWVPFLYSLQTRFLCSPVHGIHSSYALAVILVLNIVGYWTFRGANNQKNEFRTNPYNPKLVHLESMATPSGKRLLVSGWWGICRRPNYLGDLLMALAWSLPCGCTHILPFLYPITFFALLVHRLDRDEAHCSRRYGANTWSSYCSRVPYKIIPGLY